MQRFLFIQHQKKTSRPRRLSLFLLQSSLSLPFLITWEKLFPLRTLYPRPLTLPTHPADRSKDSKTTAIHSQIRKSRIAVYHQSNRFDWHPLSGMQTLFSSSGGQGTPPGRLWVTTERVRYCSLKSHVFEVQSDQSVHLDTTQSLRPNEFKIRQNELNFTNRKHNQRLAGETSLPFVLRALRRLVAAEDCWGCSSSSDSVGSFPSLLSSSVPGGAGLTVSSGRLGHNAYSLSWGRRRGDGVSGAKRIKDCWKG